MAFSEIAKFAPAIGQTIAKIPEPEDPGVIAWLDLFGVEVPVGFQFASALGMKGPLAWILDFATDPTTWALGGVTKIGALSKAGLAAAGSARLAETAARSAKYGGELLPKLILSSRAAKKAQQISELSATFAGRTAEEVGNIWGKIMGVGARLESDSFKNVARILRSDNKGKILKELDDLVARGTKGESVLHPHIVDLKRINTLVRRNELSLARGLVDGEIAKRMTLTDRLRRYGQAVQGGDVKEIRRLGKEIRKLRPSPAVARAVEKKGVDEAVELARLFRGGGKPGVLKGGLASEAAAGQRNLLALKIPFSGAEIPIIVGQKPFKWMDWVRNRAPSIRLRPVVEGARNVGLPSEALRAAEASTRGVANVDTVSSMTDASIDVMRGIQDATVHATENLYNVDTWESQAAEVVAEGLRREFVAAMPELADRKEVLLSIVTGATKMKTAVSDPERMAVVFHDMLENLSIIAEERGVI
ncbi:MAG: hypothetical protein ACE5FA_13550, partial [Dehalococcoidia bacterium]